MEARPKYESLLLQNSLSEAKEQLTVAFKVIKPARMFSKGLSIRYHYKRESELEAISVGMLRKKKALDKVFGGINSLA